MNSLKTLLLTLSISGFCLAQTTAPKTPEELRKAREEAAQKAKVEKQAAAEQRAKALKEMSYAEEFKISTAQVATGFKLGPSALLLNLDPTEPRRLLNGSPVLANGQIVKDQLSSKGKIGTGLNIGAFFRLTKGSFFFQPELQALLKGGSLKISNALDAPTRLNFAAVEIPVLIGIKHKTLRVLTGPSYGYSFGLNNNTKNLLSNYVSNPSNVFYKKNALNYNFGLGLEKKQNLFEVRLNTPLMKASSLALGTSSLPSVFSANPMNIQFSIGRILDTSN